nr:hypothetical protein Iba_chr01bCG6970 [Ipomoea batatas]
MKSSAFASTSSSTSVATLSFIVAGRRASTSSFSACLKAEDFMLADFFIFAGSLSGISTTNGVVFFLRRGSHSVQRFLDGKRNVSRFLAGKCSGWSGFQGWGFLGGGGKRRKAFGVQGFGGEGEEMKTMVAITTLRRTKKTVGVNQLFMAAKNEEGTMETVSSNIF